VGTGNLRERPRRPRPSLRSRHCSRPPATWLTTQQPGPRSRRCCARWPYRLASITLMPWAVHAHPRLPLSMMPQTDKFASLHACIWRSCAAQVHSTSTGLPANWLRLTGQHVLQVCKCCSTRTYVTGAAGPCGTTSLHANLHAGRPDTALLGALMRHPAATWAAALLQPRADEVPALLSVLLPPRPCAAPDDGAPRAL
jgi:hypothetical protein